MLDIGILSPGELSIATHPDPDSRVLRKGMVGWFVCGMKDPKEGTIQLLPFIIIRRVRRQASADNWTDLAHLILYHQLSWATRSISRARRCPHSRPSSP